MNPKNYRRFSPRFRTFLPLYYLPISAKNERFSNTQATALKYIFIDPLIPTRKTHITERKWIRNYRLTRRPSLVTIKGRRHYCTYRKSSSIPVNMARQKEEGRIPTPMDIDKNDLAMFFSERLVLQNKDSGSIIHTVEEICKQGQTPTSSESIYVGEHDNSKIFAVKAPSSAVVESSAHTLTPIRDVLCTTDDKTAQLLSRGKHLLHWHQSTQFSGCCGTPTELSKTETAKICKDCDTIIYPTTSPVIMVLIEKNGKILLARSPHFAKGEYSAIAGFVDAGETVEAAVHREVAEEVGIQVKDITYLGSQAWPFPGSLIFGFLTSHKDGKITIDPKEIEDAGWYDLSELPKLPHKCSIARHLIDHFVENAKKGTKDQK